MGQLDRLDVVYLESLPGQPPTETDPGRHPACPTALGRVLLAFSPAPLVDRILARGLRAFTDCTVTSPALLRGALATIRQTQVALTCGEFEPDMCTVAMPVVGPAGGMIAALELVVADANHDLMRSIALLEFATPALTRELAAPHLPVRRFTPEAGTADLQLAALLGAFVRHSGGARADWR